ncbi:MAG: Calx-beta domain-containing protein [Planctomycetaceae bacterium]
MLFCNWLLFVKSRLNSVNARKTRRHMRRRESATEVLENRALLSAVSFDSLTSQLSLTSGVGEIDDLAISSSGSIISITNNASPNSLVLSGDAIGNSAFTLSNVGGQDVVQIDTSLLGSTIQSFNVDLGDGDDLLDVSGLDGPLVLLPSFAILGGAGADTLTINVATLLPSDFAMSFDGGAGNDEISLSSGAGQNVTYRADSVGSANSGEILVGSSTTLTVSFQGLTPITLSGSGGDLTIDASSLPALTALSLADDSLDTAGVGGNAVTGDGGFETTFFTGYSRVQLTTGSGTQTVSVDSLDVAGGLTTVGVDGGSGDDTINIADLVDPVTVFVRQSLGDSVNVASGWSFVDDVIQTDPALGGSSRSVEEHQQGSAVLFVEGVVNFSIADAAPVDEGNGPSQFVVTARHATNINGSATVDFATGNGTALAGSDYTAVNQTLTFLPVDGSLIDGRATQTVDVVILDDAVVEGDEAFLGSLSNASDGGSPDSRLLGTPSALADIIDDDLAVITISIPTITETDANQTVNVSVSVDAAVSGGFTLDFTTALGTAEATDVTFNTVSPLSFAGTAGETQIIQLTIVGDQIVEDNETFTITLGPATALTPEQTSALSISGSPATGTINNDDSATLTLALPASITETNVNQNLNATVTLSAPVEGGLSLPFATALGTAEATDITFTTISPVSFVGTSGEVQNIAFTVVGDLIVEDNETFTITLGTPAALSAEQTSRLSTLGTPVTGTINNDDSANVSISIPSITETNANQTVNISFTVDAAVEGGFSVGFASALGTAEGSDVTLPGSGSLTFVGMSGETLTRTATILGDDIVELDETFTVTLGSVSGTTAEQLSSISVQPSDTGTIINDDLVITVESQEDNASITALTPPVNGSNGNDEDNGSYTLREAILLSNAATGDQVIKLESLAGSTIELKGTLPTITADVTIDGPAPDSPDHMLVISGNGTSDQFGREVATPGSFRLLDVGANSALTMSRLHLTKGGTSGNGGAILVGAGANIEVSDSMFSLNSAANGGAIFAGDRGNLEILNSTFVFNRSSSVGGAISLGIPSTTASSSVSVLNSTFYRNSANNGGAIWAAADAVVDITFSTLADNVAASGGAAVTAASGSIVSINNSIVAINNETRTVNGQAVGAADDVAGSGSITFSGMNIGKAASGRVNIANEDPLLSGLMDAGGPTKVLVPSFLLEGVSYRGGENVSPAVDAAGSSSFITTDQRGLSTSNGRNDIGAVEVTSQQSPPTRINTVSISDDMATLDLSFVVSSGSTAGDTTSLNIIIREFTQQSNGDLVQASSIPSASVVPTSGIDAANMKEVSRSAGRLVLNVPLSTAAGLGDGTQVTLSLGQGIYRVAVLGQNSDNIAALGYSSGRSDYINPSDAAIESDAFRISSSASLSGSNSSPSSSPVLAELPSSAVAAAMLDVSLELQDSPRDFLNWSGHSEKWVRGKDGTWYTITPDGTIRQWDRDAWLASGKQDLGQTIAQVSPMYYEDISRLSLAIDVAPLQGDSAAELLLWLDSNLELSSRSYSQFDGWRLNDRAQFGDGEKWVRGGSGQWYYLLPGGDFYRWEGGAGLQGTLIAELPAVVYQKPQLLTNAVGIQLDFTYDLQLSGGSDHANWGGQHERWLTGTGSDGQTAWFFVKPDGSFNLWDGDRDLTTSANLQNVGVSVYAGRTGGAFDGLTDLYSMDSLFADWQALVE